ncbi:hypothetical protein BDZ89DRAFT_67902 [Hymenopellis radicata]|nr:hypothetical protein BDZ89DRAFT_67902 [Hymenopellis radicata]
MGLMAESIIVDLTLCSSICSFSRDARQRYGAFVSQTNATTESTSFLGVRYADPPLGDLRWCPPITPPSSYLGIVNASATVYCDSHTWARSQKTAFTQPSTSRHQLPAYCQFSFSFMAADPRR